MRQLYTQLVHRSATAASRACADVTAPPYNYRCDKSPPGVRTGGTVSGDAEERKRRRKRREGQNHSVSNKS